MRTKLFDTDVKFWLQSEYPLTVISDRYTGTYSGGQFTAWPREFNEIEDEVCGDDGECMNFWSGFDDFVGKGPTIEAAVADLRNKLQAEMDGGFKNCRKVSDIIATMSGMNRNDK